MRELTKSLVRFSWAMPLFGVQQMANMMVPNRDAIDKVSHSLESVGGASQQELGQTLRSVYDVGDRLQRSAVDLMFSFVPGNLGAMADRMARPGGCGEHPGGPTHYYQPPAASPQPPPSADAAPPTHTAPPSGGPAAPHPSDQEQGWGPVPAQ